MAGMLLTLELARASAWDAACAHMRKNGRKAWNEEDQAIACDTLYRLMKYLPDPYPKIARRMSEAV
jgi:hypothetical protein